MADIALAVGADRAQISDWDRPNGRLRTLGCSPTSARADMDDYYLLEGYPLTCQVLEGGVIETVDADDPDGDPAEVDLLRRDGMRGLVMLPLIAKGQAIGLIELVSVGPPTSEPTGSRWRRRWRTRPRWRSRTPGSTRRPGTWPIATR